MTIEHSSPRPSSPTPISKHTPDDQEDNKMLTGDSQQVQRQAQALAQDPPRPLNAFVLPSSFDPQRTRTRLSPTATAATFHLVSADRPPSQPHRWSFSSTYLPDEPPVRGTERHDAMSSATKERRRTGDIGTRRNGLGEGGDGRCGTVKCFRRVGIPFFELGWEVNGGNSFHFSGVYHGILGSRGKTE